MALVLKSAKATADRKSMSKPGGFEDLRGQSSVVAENLFPAEVELGTSHGDCIIGGNESEESLTAYVSRKTSISQFEGKALGLDKAILHSIDCCGKQMITHSIFTLGRIHQFVHNLHLKLTHLLLVDNFYLFQSSCSRISSQFLNNCFHFSSIR